MLSSVGVKALSGKEDTTLLSMVDRRVKQMTVSTTMIWNKTPDSRVSKGERTHRGSKDPSTQKKKKIVVMTGSPNCQHVRLGVKGDERDGNKSKAL